MRRFLLAVSASLMASAAPLLGYRIKGGGLTCGGGNSMNFTAEGKFSLPGTPSGKASGGIYVMEAGFPGLMLINRGSGTGRGSLSDVYAYPNPFKPGSGGRFDADYITFANLPAEVELEIFTVSGELVFEAIKRDPDISIYRWRGENDSEALVASGIYLFRLTSPSGEEKTGKLAVIR